MPADDADIPLKIFPPPTTIEIFNPFLKTYAICSVIEFIVLKSIPNSLSPINASPESLSIMCLFLKFFNLLLFLTKFVDIKINNFKIKTILVIKVGDQLINFYFSIHNKDLFV